MIEHSLKREGTMQHRQEDPAAAHGPGADEREARIRVLIRRIDELRARWPRHSVPPAMMQELEDLEEELGRLEGESA